MSFKLQNEKKLEEKIIRNENEKEEKIKQIESLAKTKKAPQKVVESFGQRMYGEAERRKLRMDKKTKDMQAFYEEKEIEDIKQVYLKNNKHVAVYNFNVTNY